MTGSKYYVQLNCSKSTVLAKEAEASGILPPRTQYMDAGTQGHAAIETGVSEAYGDAQELVTKAEQARKALYADPPLSEIKEERFYLRESIEPIYSGKPDAVYFWKDHILFQDYKFAHQPMWEMWEKQLEAYAVLIHEETGIERIEGQLVPLCASVHTWAWDRSALIAARDRLLEVISRHNAPDAQTTPGPWCSYCSARLVCKDALLPNDTALSLARSQERLPVGSDGADFVTRLRAAIGIAGEILKWYEAELVKDPKFLAGKYVMRDGSDNVVITDNAGAAKRLSHHLSPDEQAQCMKWLPGKIRKLFQTKNNTTADIAKDLLETILGDTLEHRKAKPQMVEK